VGVIREVGLLPVAPLRFVVWVAEKVAEQADHEQNSPEARLRQLQEIENDRARGVLTDDEAAELEAQVIAQASGAGAPP
jgi:hypothetical protein